MATDDTGQHATEEPAGGDEPHATDRFDAYQEIARARARGVQLVLPRHLDGHDRRLHVRQTIREDHQQRIDEHSDGTTEKFDELASDLFSFFRGTCLLFYRDMAGDDAWMPTVMCLGDVHPENFGVMPSADDVPIFGVNDFDEAAFAPFTWDLKRGATGFTVSAAVEGGLGRKKRRKIVRRFVRGYVAGISEFGQHETELDHQIRLDTAPPLIRALIEGALQPRDEWLAEEHHDEYRRRFRIDDDELVPVTSRRDEFQEIIERFVSDNDVDVPARAGDMQVKDVAMRKGAGTASLGLPRYYVLIEGVRGDGTDDLVLELKRARRSALAGLVPPESGGGAGSGDRIAHAQTVQIVRGDVFYGSVEIGGLSFMTRERAPYRDDIDLDELSKSEWKEYAETCGRALAHAHSLSDDQTEQVGGDLESRILDAIGNPELFAEDIVRYAEDAADRLGQDHDHFRADHVLGAFERTGANYR
jgi:uncharacterized protein (DUF2252 family)